MAARKLFPTFTFMRLGSRGWRRLLSLLAALLVCTVLEAHLTEWHAERDRYAAAMPSEVREVAALFDDWSRHDPNRAAAPSR